MNLRVQLKAYNWTSAQPCNFLMVFLNSSKCLRNAQTQRNMHEFEIPSVLIIKLIIFGNSAKQWVSSLHGHDHLLGAVQSSQQAVGFYLQIDTPVEDCLCLKGQS